MRKAITRPDLSIIFEEQNKERKRNADAELSEAISAQKKPYGIWIAGKYEIIKPEVANGLQD